MLYRNTAILTKRLNKSRSIYYMNLCKTRNKITADLNSINDIHLLENIYDYLNSCKNINSTKEENSVTLNRYRNNIGFDMVPSYVQDELDKKNYYKNSNNEIDQIIYKSRYGNTDIIFDKYFMTDILVFNRSYKIKKLEYVPYYLSQCKYIYLPKDNICILDGWMIQWFTQLYNTMPHYIQYNKYTMINRTLNDISDKLVLRALISLMTETPKENLNVHNYAMLEEYNRICYE